MREFRADPRWRHDGGAAETYGLGAPRNGANLAVHFEETNNAIAARTALVPGAGMCYTQVQSRSAIRMGTVFPIPAAYGMSTADVDPVGWTTPEALARLQRPFP